MVAGTTCASPWTGQPVPVPQFKDPKTTIVIRQFTSPPTHDRLMIDERRLRILDLKSHSPRFSITAPVKPGVYRIHVWAKDGRGRVATANMPYAVRRRACAPMIGTHVAQCFVLVILIGARMLPCKSFSVMKTKIPATAAATPIMLLGSKASS